MKSAQLRPSKQLNSCAGQHNMHAQQASACCRCWGQVFSTAAVTLDVHPVNYADRGSMGLSCMLLQVEQILTLRTDLMEAAEKFRRSEAERQTLETDITSLRQQVCSMRSVFAYWGAAKNIACSWAAGVMRRTTTAAAHTVVAGSMAVVLITNNALHC